MVDWYRFHPAIPVPEGFAIMDGSPISDPQSPFAGLATLDLRDRFVRGAASTAQIGTSGGSATVDLTHAHAMPHTHAGQTGPPDTTGANYAVGGPLRAAHESHGHAVTTQGPSTPDTAHGLGVVSTEPPYVGLLKIIRIK